MGNWATSTGIYPTANSLVSLLGTMAARKSFSLWHTAKRKIILNYTIVPTASRPSASTMAENS